MTLADIIVIGLGAAAIWITKKIRDIKRKEKEKREEETKNNNTINSKIKSMKRVTSCLLFLLVSISILSCKKDKEEFVLTSNLTIVNATVDMAAIKVDPGRGVSYAAQTAINYGTNRVYALSRTRVPVKIVNAADTTVSLFNSEIELKSGIYTLFLVGQTPAAETIVNEETNWPFIRTDKILTAADSMVNVRFVNLSPNSQPVKVKIAGAATNIVDNLPYKSIGSWGSFNALTSSTSYSIEIRDAATDALLGSYSFVANSGNRFKNGTLVIRGLQGTTTGTNAFGVSVVNHF